MRRILALGCAVVLIAAACSGGDSNRRTVLVDFKSDEFAGFFLFDFPAKLAVRQGDTVAFKQTWTGEPHTVTGGSLVNEKVKAGAVWLDFFDAFGTLLAAGGSLPNPEAPGDATVGDFAGAVRGAAAHDARDKLVATYNKLRSQGVALPDLERPPDPNQPFSELVALANTESDKAFSGLPGAFTDDDQIAQNVGQPCFLRTGGPPEDPATPCAKASQKQPEFDGRQSYFNSGIIPYEGAKGNTFSVKLADDIAPGTYLFYCAVHGFGQRTEIEVKPKGSAIPSEGAVSRQARKEINEVAAPLKKVFQDAGDDGRISIPGPDGKEVQLEGPFAGLPGKDHAAITAFVPRKIKVKAGEPITWKMMAGDHTISFNVPKYFPIMEFLADGTVRINPKLQPPAGGAEPLPAQQGTGVVHHDGGTFDGSGFWSSGLIGAEPYLEYTMRITKPGTYGYACLLHPPMVGTVEVT